MNCNATTARTKEARGLAYCEAASGTMTLLHAAGALFVGRADHDEAAIGAGNRAPDEHQIVFGIDTDHAQVSRGDAFGAVSSGHSLASLRPAAAAVAGVGADAAGRAVVFLDAVAGGQTGEPVTFHAAGGAATLARAGHVYRF